MGQRRGPFRGALGRRHVPVEVGEPALAHAGLHQFQGARDPGEQIVEVVRQAPGQLADRLHLLRLPQRLLGRGEGGGGLLLGLHVAPDRVDERLVRHGRPGQPTVAAVLVPVAVLETGDDGARRKVPGRRRGGRRVIRVHQIHERDPDEFGLVPAEQGRPCGVDRHDGPVEARHEHDVGRQAPHPVAVARALLDLLLQVAGQPLQLGGHALLILDVGVGADPTGDASGGVAHRLAPRQEPAIDAVGAAQPVLGLVHGLGGPGPVPGGGHGRDIVGVDDAGPGVGAEQAPRRLAAIGVELVVEPVQRAVGIRGPDLVGDGLREDPELLLALAPADLGAKSLDGRPGAVGHVADEGELVPPPIANLTVVQEEHRHDPPALHDRHVDQGAGADGQEGRRIGRRARVGRHVRDHDLAASASPARTSP